MSNSSPYHAGFVALVGRPNVGKSTLLNALLGQKLAIATSRPQTTRNRIMGVRTYEHGQLVLVDTPGLHKPTGGARTRLNNYMIDEARTALAEVDLVAVVVEVERPKPTSGKAKAADDPRRRPLDIDGGSRHIIDEVVESKKPAILVLNKVDVARDKRDLLPLIQKLSAVHGGYFKDVVPISARRSENVDRLAEVLLSHLPEGKALYPDDMLTDRAERWLAAEFIREQVFLATHDEVPYAIAVSIDTYEERAEKNDVVIEATIHVEKPPQKMIVVGQGGEKIKDIGIKARAEISKLVGVPVHLKLFVRVDEGWTEDRRILEELGYGD